MKGQIKWESGEEIKQTKEPNDPKIERNISPRPYGI